MTVSVGRMRVEERPPRNGRPRRLRRRAIVGPRTRSEPTPLSDILDEMPIGARLREQQERRAHDRENGTASIYGPGFYTLAETADMPGAAESFIVGDGVLTIGGKLLV